MQAQGARRERGDHARGKETGRAGEHSETTALAFFSTLEKAKNHELPFFIARLLLNPGTLYQEAVDSFSPYDRIHQELKESRIAVVHLLFEALNRNIPAYILVNNRFEGCAPKTLEGIFDLIESEDR